MTVKNKKRSMLALMAILILLVGGGCLGGRYGSYTWIALIWLGIVILSTWKLTFAKGKDYLSKSNFVVGGLFSSIAFILAIPLVDAPPYQTLLAYLPFHFYIIYYVITKKAGKEQPEIALGIAGQAIEYENISVSEDIRTKCRKYIGEDELEKAIDLLIENLTPDHPNYNNAVQIKQKRNRVEREKNLNTISPDEADRQFSRIVQTLLDILDD